MVELNRTGSQTNIHIKILKPDWGTVWGCRGNTTGGNSAGWKRETVCYRVFQLDSRGFKEGQVQEKMHVFSLVGLRDQSFGKMEQDWADVIAPPNHLLSLLVESIILLVRFRLRHHTDCCRAVRCINTQSTFLARLLYLCRHLVAQPTELLAVKRTCIEDKSLQVTFHSWRLAASD